MGRRKRMVKYTLLGIIVFLMVILSALYLTNINFRVSVDQFFHKEVSEEKLNLIEINSEDNPMVYAYDEYIVVLSKGVLKSYNKDGEVVSSNEVNITSPMMNSNGKYLIIAENGGKKICVIYDNSLLWQDTLDGAVAKININANGYVSVIEKNTTYKSVTHVYNNEGVELFKSYSAYNYAVCSDISNNNRYVAIGEVDYSGTIIKSLVKIISVDLARNDPKNSTVNTYESEPGEIITDINYQIGDNAYCKFSKYVQKITSNSNERVIDFTDDMLFVDINLKNSLVIFEKHSAGLLAVDYQIKIINLTTKKETLYFQDLTLISSMKTNGDNICLNFVNSVQLLKKSGWLSKRYTSKKEIKDVIVANRIAGIIYKDKIEIIGL